MSDSAIRPARPDDAGAVSALALRSKGHWGYDEAFLEACRDELTWTPEQCASGVVQVIEADGELAGMYVLALVVPGVELDAEPFYASLGFRRTGSVASGSIPGRVVPRMEIGVPER